jgi:membrane-bound metal-dependent hydrolase YbcI (DUF457 family)
MRYQSHAAIAFLLAVVILYFIIGISDPIRLLILGAFALVAGLVPDIDHGESRGRKALDMLMIGGVSLFAYSSTCSGSICIPQATQLFNMVILFLAALGLYFIFLKFGIGKHRGITHTVVACTVFSVLVYFFISLEFALTGFIGYFSHLVADKQIKIL